jgi:hypothetical protein
MVLENWINKRDRRDVLLRFGWTRFIKALRKLRAGLRQTGIESFSLLTQHLPLARVTRLRDVLGYFLPSLAGLDFSACEVRQ